MIEDPPGPGGPIDGPPDPSICTPRQEKIDEHAITVVLKPNTPASIGYQSNTVESGSTDTNGKFTITWGASSEGPLVSGYQWCQEVNGTWQSTSSCPRVSKSTRTRALPTTTGVMPSGQYRYRVRAYANIGSYYQYSGWRTSSALSVKHFPTRVSGWLEPGGGTLPGPSFSLKWSSVGNPDASDPITHYQLQWSVDGGGYGYVPFVGSLDGSNLGKTTSVTISKANTGRDITAAVYKFRARACNSSGCGPWSPIKQLNPPTPPTPRFSDNLPNHVYNLDYTITWANVGANSYQLKRMRLGQNESGCVVESDGNCWRTVVTTSGTSYFDGGSAPGSYRYKLDACNDFACKSVLSPWVKVHSLQHTDEPPAVTTEAPDTPGTLAYNADVSASGSAEITVPVQVAPGVNGLQPNLSLRYTSARFNKRMNEALPEDILGHGWRVGGLSNIRRCVVNRPSSDRVRLTTVDSLCLDGEPLVLVSGTHWQAGATYRTLRDSFYLIELQKNTANKIWFKVKTPNGSIKEYGATADSRLRD
ncbi:hypothetical protein, partial [Microbulbifer sp. 2205BS26-8]|uniref:hypothetical protein n=1 Tax=Microbulbifer sp. 2205BS26-8 TaxID=3064386 RepID=UPI002740099B